MVTPSASFASEATSSYSGLTGLTYTYAEDSNSLQNNLVTPAALTDTAFDDCYLRHGRGQADPNGMSLSVVPEESSDTSLVVRLQGSISDPLTPQALTPSVTWDRKVKLDASNPLQILASVTGSHDCYPAYELYINNQPIVQDSPTFRVDDAGVLNRVVNFARLGTCLAGIGSISLNTGTVIIP